MLGFFTIDTKSWSSASFFPDFLKLVPWWLNCLFLFLAVFFIQRGLYTFCTLFLIFIISHALHLADKILNFELSLSISLKISSIKICLSYICA